MKQSLIIIWIVFLPIILSAQMLSRPVSDSLDKVMYQKSEEVGMGAKTALFYFANLLDDTIKIQLHDPVPSNPDRYFWYYLKDRVLYYLRWETDFKNLKLDKTLTKARFLDYLSDETSSIYYSPFIQKFTDTPLENFKIKYRLKEKNKEKSENIDFGNFDEFWCAYIQRRR